MCFVFYVYEPRLGPVVIYARARVMCDGRETNNDRRLRCKTTEGVGTVVRRRRASTTTFGYTERRGRVFQIERQNRVTVIAEQCSSHDFERGLNKRISIRELDSVRLFGVKLQSSRRRRAITIVTIQLGQNFMTAMKTF